MKRTTNDGDRVLGSVSGFSDSLSRHGGRTNDIESGDSKETLGVESTGLLEDFSGDGDLLIDKVGP